MTRMTYAAFAAQAVSRMYGASQTYNTDALVSSTSIGYSPGSDYLKHQKAVSQQKSRHMQLAQDNVCQDSVLSAKSFGRDDPALDMEYRIRPGLADPAALYSRN
ncbi:hypothetical protein GF351_02625 [Candidatus Woesearchaeota archaeon]|nr:hypothetical protein [Candidatus Woesearchaeota archaeon]